MFKIHGGDVPVEIGKLANVTSLSAVGTGASTTLVAVSDGQLQRFDPTASAWTPTEKLPNDAVAGDVVALDADSFLVGTDNGVARSDDSGASFVLAGEPVVGAPARTGGAISWLLADHSGLARSTDGGVSWPAVKAPGIATAANALAYVPSLGLVTTGGQVPLVSSADGVKWEPLTVQPPYHPDGIARAGSGAGTASGRRSAAKPGSPSAADAVLRLADSGP